MANDRYLQMLGIAKRAGLLSQGHDVCVDAVKKGKACMCLFASDASERLVQEFERLLRSMSRTIPIKRLNYSMSEIGYALSYKTAVITINDEGIANKLNAIEKTQNGEEN
ncbi:MAG: ribosomal L7Ae/L30e/S12e/Gadd45 family protein [Clostridia bacterium]|nr:ribosomal L7Ae/L30e/S12e/Gadd45 family protein [Clostridia bacterium]